MGFDEDLDDEMLFYNSPYFGPSGSKGQSILKSSLVTGSSSTGGIRNISSLPHHSRHLESLCLETSSPEISPLPARKFLGTSALINPKMDYYSYRAAHAPLYNDDIYTSRGRASALATSTLDDNDLISRRSRLNDARVLNNISMTVGALNAYNLPTTHVPLTPAKKRHIRARRTAPTSIITHGTNINTGYVNTGYIYPLDTTSSGYSVLRTPRNSPGQAIQRKLEIDTSYLARGADTLGNLKLHVDAFKAGLGNQKMLLDRYLPIEMGPMQSVDQGVNKKYYELTLRIPGLEPESYRRRTYLQDDAAIRLVPCHAMRSQSVDFRHLGSYVPMSDTRKNLRRLITKGRGDPHFFS